MQDITKTKCNSIAEGTEGRLIDTRDNKVYWVAKLKDGLCWMTQNLDYDGGGTNAGLNFPNDTTARYYDPGEIIYLGGTAVNVSNMTPSTDSSFSGFMDGYYYNAHYLVGNYYNYNAATNGTGASVTTNGANASGSVCPTGWSLPTSNNTNTGSFGGLTSGISAGSILAAAPYYFVYGGGVNNSSLNGAGSGGLYWSSTVYSAYNAYSLNFNSGSVNPPYDSLRYNGLSVRCVAR